MHFRSFFANFQGGGGPFGFSGDGDDDDDGDGMHSFPMGAGGMPGGMGMGSSGGRPRTKQRPSARHASAPPPETSEITRPLALSLEDLYAGATKHLKVGRRLRSGRTEEKVLEIAVLPGWKSGTKIRFPRAGNEVDAGGPGGEPQSQDLVFVVEEKPHARFAREDANLVLKERVSLVDALLNTGGTRSVQHLDGRRVSVPLPAGVIKPGAESRVPGEGMPIRKEGAVKRKGDLIVRWEVDFPDRLSAAQKEGIKKVLG